MKKNFVLFLVLPISLLCVACGKDAEPTINEKLNADITVKDGTNIKNIIYVIGDGMGFNSIKAGELATNTNFAFTKWAEYQSNTNSLNDKGLDVLITDSAAAGTALASGTLTINGRIGKDKEFMDVETIFDVAKTVNKSVGIVTTDTINGATPAAFSAHANDRDYSEEIVNSQANSEVDLFIGNYSDLYETNKTLFEQKNFTYSKNLNSEILSKERLIINNENMSPYSEANSLRDSVEYAVDYLSKNNNGFTLMIEQAHIDKASHSNDFNNMVRAAVELNKTLDYLIDRFKDQSDTLIVVTADHETGGLKVSPEMDLKNIYLQDDISFAYEYSTNSHTTTHVPVYLNQDIFNFVNLEDNASYTVIKNIQIARGMKNLLLLNKK
ncbi:MAG: alkaline phosphatase [Firmicutes bacterium]|nr:alkaline phosphatase [Candidatus Fiminaster equi]